MQSRFLFTWFTRIYIDLLGWTSAKNKGYLHNACSMLILKCSMPKWIHEIYLDLNRFTWLWIYRIYMDQIVWIYMNYKPISTLRVSSNQMLFIPIMLKRERQWKVLLFIFACARDLTFCTVENYNFSSKLTLDVRVE